MNEVFRDICSIPFSRSSAYFFAFSIWWSDCWSYYFLGLLGPEDVYNGHLPNLVVANTLDQPEIGIDCYGIRYQVASSVKYHMILLNYFR